MTRLYTEKINVHYGEQCIIEDLNLVIPDQKITAIIGPNGCGKSTSLKALTRMIPTHAGHVLLDGLQIAKQPTKEVAKKLAILPQTQEAASGLTVGELVSYGRYPYQTGFGRLSKKDHAVIDWALEATQTTPFKHRVVDALSGGQRQRVWIAMALAQETDIILLDEPTTYLDMAHQLEVLQLLERLNKEEKRTIVMVLHDLNQAARFADYMIAMRQGKIIRSGSCEDVMQASVLQDVFHINATLTTDPNTNKPICLTYHLL